MKYFLPLLAFACFAMAGVGCKSTCCGTCDAAAHGHSHDADAKTCCGTGGACCK